MQFINIRELSRSPSKFVKIANEKDDIVITKNGHPYALLSKIDDEALESFIISKHLDLESDFEEAHKEYKNGKTKSVRTLLHEINKKLSDEI